MHPIAILTGASSGIGAAAAEQFLEAQYTVINLSRRECPIPEVTTLTTDLSDTQSLANSSKALCEIVTAVSAGAGAAASKVTMANVAPQPTKDPLGSFGGVMQRCMWVTPVSH